MGKGTTFVPYPGENTRTNHNQNPDGNSPIEKEIHEANRAILRILDTGNFTDQDIAIINNNPGKIKVEDLLDTVVTDSDICDVIGVKKLRSDTKSRIICSLQKLELLSSHLEGPKRKNSSETKDKRIIRVDDDFITILKQNINNL